VLSVVAVVGGLFHAVKVGYYLNDPWKVGLWVAYSGALVALLVWVRILKPFGQRRTPWRVARVDHEADRTTTLVLEPEGHGGVSFQAGQFAWLAVDRSPFALTKHPFSFSSSAERAPAEVALSIKARGDFTGRIADTVVGTRVYLDGPHGVFTIDRHQGEGFVFIGGGVGITPLLSMLSTLADRGDRRPCLLVLANQDADSIPFRAALDALEARLDLVTVHVLRHPPSGWTGESGRIDGELLARHLTAAHRRFQFFICGATTMMDSLEDALVQLGVPFEQVHTERFDMV
jgi:predicted ferric reductase